MMAKNQMISNLEHEHNANSTTKQEMIEQLERDLDEAMMQVEVKQTELNDLNDLLEMKEQDFNGIQSEIDLY